MDSTIDAVAEIFSWVGFGLGAVVAGIALVMYVFDGTWLPTRGVLDDGEHGRVVRWFDEDGGVNEARLTHEQERALAGKSMADIYYRRGGRGRMRLTQGSPAVRAVAYLSLGLLGVGIVALATSMILLFTRG
ncbi:hypothetical protein [Microbacterium gallinarum]|jgi:hypothetical protein|uniref:Leucyl-tRNA synthetase n=1 Tax=Microbacterium gallinarum TaxID=2762209 RepID=A0ABR8X289_9MICO|nr:hypothetical protein [Microbacterium gallinarum]MBD8023403.1 hypothetical protein [Microbacterium gallinarum]